MSIGTYAAALHAAHQVADHWVQTEHQAAHKAEAGWPGWRANLAHVASYTATQALAAAAVSAVSGTRPTAGRAAAALAVSAACHAAADRRAPLARLSRALGKERFWQLASGGMSGSYLLDQSWHQLTSVFLPALILTSERRR